MTKHDVKPRATLTDVPVDEGTLRVHEIELVVDAREHLSDGGGVRDHADRAHDLGEGAARQRQGRRRASAAGRHLSAAAPAPPGSPGPTSSPR